MPTQVQRRRGTTAQHAVFSGQLAETTIDTDKMTVVVQDGVTLGGHPLATEANLTAHITDTTAAHAASAISIVDTGLYFTGTNVEAALQELGATTTTTVAGTYTPTGTPVLNCTSVNTVVMLYSKTGSVVSFTLYADFTATAAGQLSFDISLPVASNLALFSDALGTGTFYLAGYTSPIAADAGARTATDLIRITTTSGGASTYFGTIVGQYIIQ